MRFLEIVESRQEAHHALDLAMSRIQILSNNIINEMRYFIEFPELLTNPIAIEVLKEIDLDIEKLEKVMLIVKIGIVGNSYEFEKIFLRQMLSNVKKKRDIIEKHKSDLNEADLPPTDAQQSSIPGTPQSLRPRVKVSDKKDRELRKWMGHR